LSCGAALSAKLVPNSVFKIMYSISKTTCVSLLVTAPQKAHFRKWCTMTCEYDGPNEYRSSVIYSLSFPCMNKLWPFPLKWTLLVRWCFLALPWYSKANI
jgi:hypothetical protein